ncbi:hypothetical protein MPSEU_000507800 [Mayamaea pseudoterrestris]|nr:hypothetical protein MPSEU_000507800 [Mayamaea pseudoterrestris]
MGFRGCCSWPHGQFSILAMIFGIITYLLVQNATYRCNYWTVDSNLNASTTNGDDDWGVGLYSYEGLGSDGNKYCYTYSSEQMQSFWDGPFVAAYVFAIIANLCTGICMVLLFILGCFNFERNVIRGIAIASIFGALCMALTFVSYASFITDDPYNGTFSTDSGLAIGATIAALITGILLCSTPSAKPPLEQAGAQAYAPGTVTTTETVMPDGNRKIIKTTVNPDGSQTVTETVEHDA